MDIGILKSATTGLVSSYSVPVIQKTLEILKKANQEALFD